MVLRVMTSMQTVQTIIEQHEGRFSVELGIDLLSGRSREIFRWFLASVLFGARISEGIVKKTFREFGPAGESRQDFLSVLAKNAVNFLFTLSLPQCGHDTLGFASLSLSERKIMNSFLQSPHPY